MDDDLTTLYRRYGPVMAMGLSVALDARSQRGDGFRETSALALIGYRFGASRGAWSAAVGPEFGAGVIMQSSAMPLAYSGVLALGLTGTLAYDLSARASLVLEASVPAELFKRDGETSVVLLPAAWLGVAARL